MEQEQKLLDFLQEKEKIFLIFLYFFLFWQIDESIAFFKHALVLQQQMPVHQGC